MIRLKNVSKFYYSKGVIATGFTKVNLELKMGEFVAITGESGSGKSTLLNVISGLDTYEEGEMYVNGHETSHFREEDFEDYRRRYIGNIFQNFNLINSYTVYQNIELALLLNGKKKKHIKKDIIELIKKVGLYKFRNTKVSKLSGGQKQRVAIARALAKNTPVIIADEPTGNLDSKSAIGIIKLLADISKDKLVIIVTHNFEQVSEYATRVIKMHDGKILEDKKKEIKDTNDKVQEIEYKNITFFNKLRLGLRNTFNIIPKFVLLLLVFLFITAALLSEYSSFKKQEYVQSKTGYNNYFLNRNDKRIIIKKKNKNNITDNDISEIEKLDNIDYIIKNDVSLDNNINITDEKYLWMSGNVLSIDLFLDSLDEGRMPENDNEVIISGNKDEYYLSDYNELLNKEFYIENELTGDIDKNNSIKIVGIKYVDEYDDIKFYVSNKTLEQYTFNMNQKYSNVKVLFQDKYHESNYYDVNYNIEPNVNVLDGEVYVSSDLNDICKYNNCLNEPLTIEISNLYYKDSITLNVSKVYSKYNIKRLLDIDNYDENNGKIFISFNDYNNMYNKGIYQSSVFVSDVEKIDDTIKDLDKLGYDTLKIKDTLVKNEMSNILRIFKTIVTIILVITLFFITYFVIRIILKSRNVYFSTIRMLGATVKVSRSLLIIELLTVSNIAYFATLLLEYLNYKKIIKINYLNTVMEYLKVSDYVILYLILIFMSYFISLKFAKKLFKNSAIQTLNEEV